MEGDAIIIVWARRWMYWWLCRVGAALLRKGKVGGANVDFMLSMGGANSQKRTKNTWEIIAQVATRLCDLEMRICYKHLKE